MDISNESNEVLFFKQSDVHHSTMNEPDPDNKIISVCRDIGLSSGAREGLAGASNVPLSSESANMKNITYVLSDQFKEIQSELTHSLGVFVMKLIQICFACNLKSQKILMLWRVILIKNLKHEKHIGSNQINGWKCQKPHSKSPSTIFLVSENKNENYQTPWPKPIIAIQV